MCLVSRIGLCDHCFYILWWTSGATLQCRSHGVPTEQYERRATLFWFWFWIEASGPKQVYLLHRTSPSEFLFDTNSFRDCNLLRVYIYQ
jgi:hypothetical protein